MNQPSESDTYGLAAMSEEAKSFLSDLEDLCRHHGIEVAVSGYDGIDLWKLKAGDYPVYCAGIKDRTQDSEGVRQ